MWSMRPILDPLTITHESTLAMKLFKIHILTARFEKVRMKDDKTFLGFYAKLSDIVNSRFNLKENIVELIKGS